MNRVGQMVIVEVKICGIDKVLLYGTNPNYHLIASTRDKVEVGNTVEYEPYGINFGLFKRVVRAFQGSLT